MNIDGGKNLTVRGQRTWIGMKHDQNKGFEVGESSSVTDFIKAKLRKTEHTCGHVVEKGNIIEFVEENSTSLWAKKDQATHVTYQY